MHAIPMSVAEALNTLSAGLILICAFAMVGTRQVQGVLRFFVVQSLLLAASSFLLASSEHSIHLWALGAITIAAKVIAIPWVLKRTLARDLYERREIAQAVNIPASLLLSLLLAIAAELLVVPVASASSDPVVGVDLPIGLACVRSPLVRRSSLQVQNAGVGTLPQAVSMGRLLSSRTLRPCTSESAMKSGVLVAFTANTPVGLLTATPETLKKINLLTEPVPMPWSGCGAGS